VTHSGLSLADAFVLLVYLAGTVLLGSRFAKGRTTSRSFYLAGQNLSWIPVGLSTVAALISGNTYLGLPSEVRSHGLAFLILPFSIILAIPIATNVFLPFFRRLQVISAYEYLEKRFDVRVRCLASALFVVWRLIWLAMVIYVPALAFSTVTGMSIVVTIILLGLLTTLYTAMGGIEAVIWTDVAQFFVMVGAALLTIWVVGTHITSGLPAIWQSAAEAGRTRLLNFSLDPTVRMTFWGALVGGAFANLAYLGADQVIVQRYLTAKSGQDARWSIVLSGIGTIVIVVPLAVLGLALYAFYHEHPQLLPSGIEEDKVFPYFIAHEFPNGVAGLLIAAIFAATMSSLSSGINAVSAAIDIDFVQRFSIWQRKSGVNKDARQLRFARLLSTLIGACATVLACFVGRLGTIVEIGLRFIDGFSGPLLGLFVLGMFSRRATPEAAFLGALLGIATTTAVNFASPFSFTWFPAIGCLTTLGSGYAISWLGNPPPASSAQWVYCRGRDRVSGDSVFS